MHLRFPAELNADDFLQERAKLRMMKQQPSDRTESYWGNLWGNPKDYESSGMGDVKIHKRYTL